MHRAARLLSASAFLLLVTASGCSHQAEPTAPQAQDSRLAVPASSAVSANSHEGPGLYPLTVGSSWRLRGHTIRRMITPGAPPQVLGEAFFDLDLDLTCADSGTVIERLHEEFSNGGAITVWRRYRQTGEGLWISRPQALPSPCGESFVQSGTGRRLLGQARRPDPSGLPRDGALRAVVAASLARLERKRSSVDLLAADPSAPEIRLLAYPLRPGQTWIQQPLAALPVTMTVEAHETLKTPIGAVPAWRIRVDNPFFEPGRDHSHVWYGRSGYLQLASHLEDDVTENGAVVGMTTSDETHTLESVQLAGPGRFAAGPVAGEPGATPLRRAGSARR